MTKKIHKTTFLFTGNAFTYSFVGHGVFLLSFQGTWVARVHRRRRVRGSPCTPRHFKERLSKDTEIKMKARKCTVQNEIIWKIHLSMVQAHNRRADNVKIIHLFIVEKATKTGLQINSK